MTDVKGMGMLDCESVHAMHAALQCWHASSNYPWTVAPWYTYMIHHSTKSARGMVPTFTPRLFHRKGRMALSWSPLDQHHDTAMQQEQEVHT